jgi:hypothetical protein
MLIGSRINTDRCWLDLNENQQLNGSKKILQLNDQKGAENTLWDILIAFNLLCYNRF